MGDKNILNRIYTSKIIHLKTDEIIKMVEELKEIINK